LLLQILYSLLDSMISKGDNMVLLIGIWENYSNNQRFWTNKFYRSILRFNDVLFLNYFMCLVR